MITTSASRTKSEHVIPMRRISLLILSAILPMLSQCGGIGGYKSISYSKGKLATPPTTLSQRDYPFDSKGRYRTDWVKSGSTKKRSKSSFVTAAAPPAQPSVAQSPPKTSSRKSKSKQSSKTMTVASNTTRSSKPKSPPPPVYTPPPAPTLPKPKASTPKKPQARYHNIAKGDTLWGISRRYKVSIPAIKTANGLSSDLIRPGQTLRIP